MQSYIKKHHAVSFQRTALLIMSAIALPLFIVIILFEWNTAQSYQASVNTAYQSTLSAYQTMVEDSLDMAQRYIVDAAANNIDFQMITHAKNKIEVYLASIEIEKQCKPLLQAHELIGGFYVCSSAYDYCHIISADSYPHEDLSTIQSAVTEAACSDNAVIGWTPLILSDRTVFLYTFVTQGNVIATMVDPNRQVHSGLEPGSKIFFTSITGTPLAPKNAFGDPSFPSPDDWGKVFQDKSKEKYNLIYLTLPTVSGYIVYAVPYKTFFGQLNTMQRFLMIITLCLLISIPICWLLLQSLLLQPLNSLTETTQAIKTGHTDTRVPRDSNIYEVNAIAETVNTMLDTIQQQKIEAYEWELSVRDLRLQYLQLQLRPHFFLNCLNLIYSLAGEKKYADLQELALNLSIYLRNNFKDSSRLVTLTSEINSVESYIHIQGTGMQFPPLLEVFVDFNTDEFLIPPISVLTFVENAVKHATPEDAALEIHIKCELLYSEEGNYLNITICDNGCGFSQEKLKELNAPDNKNSINGHIGISNIRHRLQFLYGDHATISFRNRSNGACVELFIPITNDMTGGVKP